MKYNVGWGLTNSCNMNCKFCYSKEQRIKIKEAKLEDWIKFVDQNHNQIDSINYGTGENALSDDFFTFIDYVRSNYPDITQALTSNGYIYYKVSKNPKYKEVYKRCIDEVDISLDFCDRDKHNDFRGQKFAYDWAIGALNMLKEDNKKATIVFVGFNDTLKHDNLDGLFKIAKKYNALLRMNIYRPVSDIKEINQRFILKYETLIDSIKYINENYSIVSLNDVLIGNLFSKSAKIIENTGVDSIRILPDGSICPSTYLITEEYKNKYSIYDDNVLSDLKFPDFIEPIIPEKCKGCSIKDKCRGGVIDRRFLWNETLEMRDPYCPKENGYDVIVEDYKFSKIKRVSVHDGYLPTLFFSNKGE